jgi:hypothetical protein
MVKDIIAVVLNNLTGILTNYNVPYDCHSHASLSVASRDQPKVQTLFALTKRKYKF